MYQRRPTNQQLSTPLIGGFYVENGEGKKSVKPTLFDDTAQKIANTFYITVNKGKGPINDGIGRTQLRRIFDEVKHFDTLLKAESTEWADQLPYIKMIKSKVRYAITRMKLNTSREIESCYTNLGKFVEEGIDAIETRQDYEVFLSLFEAVYGFYYEFAPSK